MLLNKDYKFWFCTGSQDLYGDECLAHVAEHSKIIVDALNKSVRMFSIQITVFRDHLRLHPDSEFYTQVIDLLYQISQCSP